MKDESKTNCLSLSAYHVFFALRLCVSVAFCVPLNFTRRERWLSLRAAKGAKKNATKRLGLVFI